MTKPSPIDVTTHAATTKSGLSFTASVLRIGWLHLRLVRTDAPADPDGRRMRYIKRAHGARPTYQRTLTCRFGRTLLMLDYLNRKELAKWQ